MSQVILDAHADDLEAALDSLGEAYRQIILLRKFDDLPDGGSSACETLHFGLGKPAVFWFFRRGGTGDGPDYDRASARGHR